MTASGTASSAISDAAAADTVSALRVLHHGDLVHAIGPQDVPVPVHSVRKSLMSTLIGTLVDNGTLRLDTTLASLGIDDHHPLTPTESAATVEDLLTSSSAIYLPMDGPAFDVFTGSSAPWPARGSAAPGTRFHYNNWDFNVLGEVYQRAGGTSIFMAIDQLIARPLGFHDWDPMMHSRLYYGHDPLGATPRYPNYALQLSARDLATFGQLYLDGGELHGRRVVSTDWVHRSTRPIRHTGHPEPFSRYGFLWWAGSGAPGGLPAGSFAAIGLGGPVLCVVPSLDLVIVAVSGATGAERGRIWLPRGVITAIMQNVGGDS